MIDRERRWVIGGLGLKDWGIRLQSLVFVRQKQT